MGQLTDITYNILKQDKRAYEIMLLRDQYDNTFTNIAKEYGISVAMVTQIYYRLKVKQIRLYINHIAVVLGHESTIEVKKVCENAYDFYWDLTYTCAYMEKKYKDILTEYRNGEPGMPTQFIKSMPAFKSKLSKKTIALIVAMREDRKASFITIAKELRITAAKAKRAYDWFYHEKVLELIKILQDKAESQKEKSDIWEHYFRGSRTSKKRYDMLTKE